MQNIKTNIEYKHDLYDLAKACFINKPFIKYFFNIIAHADKIQEAFTTLFPASTYITIKEIDQKYNEDKTWSNFEVNQIRDIEGNDFFLTWTISDVLIDDDNDDEVAMATGFQIVCDPKYIIQVETIKKILEECVYDEDLSGRFFVIGTDQNGMSMKSEKIEGFEIDLELNYGKNFMKVHDKIIHSLEHKNHGLVLFFGPSGTGKCVTGNTFVTLKNKITNNEYYTKIVDFIKFYEEVPSKILDDDKIIEILLIENYEILTDDGFKDVIALHKTIEYKIFKLVLKESELQCADNHIVFLEDNTEIFVKDLISGQLIKTINGIKEVLYIEETNLRENMYDFELSDNNVKYYTNGILSHNTYFLRYLIKTLCDKKDIIVIPTFLMNELANPDFISFIRTMKNSILILEDAEEVLIDREIEGGRNQAAISNILNITNGLLNDALQIQIIATFNMNKKSIDKALLRAGRLIEEWHFDNLTVEESNLLAKKLGSSKVYTKPTALADIYDDGQNLEAKTHKKIKRQQKNRVGFKEDDEETN